MFYFRVVLLMVFLVLDRGLVAGAGAAPTKMIVAYASISPRVAPLWVAQEQGFFKKNGIEAELIFVRGAPTLVAALTSGDMDIGYTGGTAVLGASAAGIDLKILAVLTNRVTYDLVVRPEIKRPEDLRGKRFGVTSIGGTLWMGAVLGLERLGIDTTRDDIRFMVIGDQVVLSQALEENRIDATVVDIVFSKRLHEKGFPILAEFHKSNLPIAPSRAGFFGYRRRAQPHEQFVDEAAFIESAQDLIVHQIFDLGVSDLGITELHQPLDVAQPVHRRIRLLVHADGDIHKAFLRFLFVHAQPPL